MPCMFARNHTKSILQLSRNLSLKENVKIFPILTSRYFWHLANISNSFTFSSSLLYFETAPQPSLSLKLNSSLRPLLRTILWMILGIFLLLLHPLTTSSLKSKLSIITFSMPSLALILERLTVWIESLLFSKAVFPSLLPAWSNSFVCILYFYLSFLLEVCSSSTCP